MTATIWPVMAQLPHRRTTAAAVGRRQVRASGQICEPLAIDPAPFDGAATMPIHGSVDSERESYRI